MAKFSRNLLQKQLKVTKEIWEENDNSIEYITWVYPYSDSCDNIKDQIIEEIKYGYKFFHIFL